jgi:hypothetical protein
MWFFNFLRELLWSFLDRYFEFHMDPRGWVLDYTPDRPVYRRA